MSGDYRAAAIAALIEPTIESAGHDLVRVAFSGDRKLTLQIMIERKDRRAVDVDDCAKISRAVSALMDVEDPVPEAYTLEVSSPGIDRPLVRLEDFDRFAGFEAKVEMADPIEGRRRFSGRLKGVQENAVVMDCDGQTAELPFEGIGKASLTLTDELIEATRKAWEAAAKEG